MQIFFLPWKIFQFVFAFFDQTFFMDFAPSKHFRFPRRSPRPPSAEGASNGSATKSIEIRENFSAKSTGAGQTQSRRGLVAENRVIWAI